VSRGMHGPGRGTAGGRVHDGEGRWLAAVTYDFGVLMLPLTEEMPAKREWLRSRARCMRSACSVHALRHCLTLGCGRAWCWDGMGRVGWVRVRRLGSLQAQRSFKTS